MHVYDSTGHSCYASVQSYNREQDQQHTYALLSAWMPPRHYYAWLTCSNNIRKKERGRSTAGLSVHKSVCRCGAYSWERDIANICHRRIAQEKRTDEWQKNSTSKQNIVTIILTNVTKLNVSHQKHVNYLNFAWASVISVVIRRKYRPIISHLMTFVKQTKKILKQTNTN